jgi:hypothetical protein
MSATFIVFVCARLICGRAVRAESDADAGAAVAAAARAMAPFDFDVEFRAADLDRTVSNFCLSPLAYRHPACLRACS